MKLMTMMYPSMVPVAVLSFSHEGLTEFDVLAILPINAKSSAIVMRVPDAFEAADWQDDEPGYRKRMRDAARRWRRGEPEILVLAS